MAQLDEISQAIGALQASVQNIQTQVSGMNQKLDGVIGTQSEQRGGWKVAGAFATAGGVVGGGLLHAFLNWLHK